MNTLQPRTTLFLATTGLVTSGGLLLAGPLAPPAGPVAPTYKTLGEIEPRIAISSIPFSITQPGSYYLAHDCSVAAAVSGITVNALRVTIDLNGFALLGGAGTQKGIVTVGSPTGLAVINGRIENFDLRGIEASNAAQCRYDNLTITGCGSDGLLCGDNCIITNCIAKNNSEDGIDTGQNCVVSRCVATSNGSDGFEVEGYSVVSNCTAASNTGNGLYVQVGCRVTNCLADRNTLDGIYATSLCTVIANTCTSNGFNGTGGGVHVSGSDNRIEDNAVNLNDYGLRVIQAGNLVIHNSASGNTSTNFSVVAGNAMGVIVTTATIAANTNPHANYDF